MWWASLAQPTLRNPEGHLLPGIENVELLGVEAFLPARNNFGGPDFLSAGNNSRVREVIVSIEPSENMPKLALGVSVLRGVGSARNDNALQVSAFWHF